jgi:Zn-finger nucleic acid-binding protein
VHGEGQRQRPLSSHACPACGDSHPLTSRSIGAASLPVLECPRCAGFWVGTEAFEVLLSRARDAASAAELMGAGAGERAEVPKQPPDGRAYRPCPLCRKLMHRWNFGRRSGVIIDNCRTHGFWFDAEELNTILHWVRAGKEAQTKKLQEEQEQFAARQRQMQRQMAPTTTEWEGQTSGGGALVDVVGWLVKTLFGF